MRRSVVRRCKAGEAGLAAIDSPLLALGTGYWSVASGRQNYPSTASIPTSRCSMLSPASVWSLMTKRPVTYACRRRHS
eukprot:364647-Chlamydomonas_euryale.AAC.20